MKETQGPDKPQWQGVGQTLLPFLDAWGRRRWMMDHSKEELPPTPRLVLIALEAYADINTGECYPRQQTLADATGYSRATVNGAVQWLVDKGFLSVLVRKNKGQASKYILTKPVKEADRVGPAEPVKEADTPVNEADKEPVNLPYNPVNEVDSGTPHVTPQSFNTPLSPPAGEGETGEENEGHEDPEGREKLNVERQHTRPAIEYAVNDAGQLIFCGPCNKRGIPSQRMIDTGGNVTCRGCGHVANHPSRVGAAV